MPAPQDPAIDALLATIRGLSHRIAEEHDPAAVQALVRERGQHERAVRLAWAATPGSGGQAVPVADAELVEHLGDRVLVQLVDVDGTLHAVVRARRTVADRGGRPDRAGAAASTLRCTACAPPPAAGRSTWAGWGSGWRRRCSATSVRLLPGGRPVVVSPPAALLAAPWGLLPALHDRPVALTPSATAWVRARGGRPLSSRAVFVVGPDLPTGGGEVAPVAGLHDGAALLTSGDATVAAHPGRARRGRRWGTSPRTGPSGRRRRCSPACTSPTAP